MKSPMNRDAKETFAVFSQPEELGEELGEVYKCCAVHCLLIKLGDRLLRI